MGILNVYLLSGNTIYHNMGFVIILLFTCVLYMAIYCDFHYLVYNKA